MNCAAPSVEVLKTIARGFLSSAEAAAGAGGGRKASAVRRGQRRKGIGIGIEIEIERVSLEESRALF